MTVEVRSLEPGASRFAISFVDPKFAGLYGMQRHHCVSHLIPTKYVEDHLADSEWIELAPGENPEDVAYPDEGLVLSIKSDVMTFLSNVGFVEAMEDAFCPLDTTRTRQMCYGDFRFSKSVLASCGVPESDFFDVFHVLMSEGGFCDCEILYNACGPNRLQAEYWHARAQNFEPYNAHKGS